MENTQRRHDITDAAWNLLEPLLPGQTGQWGGKRKIIGHSSTACFGFYGLERRGGICLPIMAVGTRYNVAFVVSGTKVFGRRYWKL